MKNWFGISDVSVSGVPLICFHTYFDGFFTCFFAHTFGSPGYHPFSSWIIIVNIIFVYLIPADEHTARGDKWHKLSSMPKRYYWCAIVHRCASNAQTNALTRLKLYIPDLFRCRIMSNSIHMWNVIFDWWSSHFEFYLWHHWPLRHRSLYVRIVHVPISIHHQISLHSFYSDPHFM